MPSTEFNLTTTNTYITVSKSGSVRGPWTTPLLVRGMENRPKPDLGIGGYSWSCASGNPSPAYHPNGTLFAAVRQNPCWTGRTTREHIGLWRCVENNPGMPLLVFSSRPFQDVTEILFVWQSRRGMGRQVDACKSRFAALWLGWWQRVQLHR